MTGYTYFELIPSTAIHMTCERVPAYLHGDKERELYEKAARCISIVHHLMKVGDWNDEAYKYFKDTYILYFASPLRVKDIEYGDYLLRDDRIHILDAAQRMNAHVPVIIVE